MTNDASIYMGEDAELTVTVLDAEFDEVQDVIVGFVVGQTLRKTCKKTSNVSSNQVTAHGTDASKCIARIFRSETATWPKGPLSVEVTIVYSDVNFPQGRHVAYKQYLCEFDTYLTKAS